MPISDLASQIPGMKLLDIVSGVFDTAAELIDDLHTSEEEKLEQQRHLLTVQVQALQQALDYERQILLARASIVEAEAKSEHWVTATWRPIVMLGMFALVTLDSLGILPYRLSEEAWTLLQFGLGGYVVGRSAEKVIKTIKATPGGKDASPL